MARQEIDPYTRFIIIADELITELETLEENTQPILNEHSLITHVKIWREQAKNKTLDGAHDTDLGTSKVGYTDPRLQRLEGILVEIKNLPPPYKSI